MAQAAKTTSRTRRSANRTSTSRSADVSALNTRSTTARKPAAKKTPAKRSSARSAAAAPAVMPLGANGLLGAAASAEITDELEKGGPAFGSFVGAVGTSVADAQAKLDKTFIETAQALSQQKVKVVSVFEQVVDDEGKLTDGRVHETELPLINYITPTAYKWSRVFLQADMQVAEFGGESGMRIKGHSTGFSIGARASYGLFSGFNAMGSTAFSTSSYGQEVTANQQTDNAAGQLHMEATLEPRDDIRPPQPFILQKGPTLRLLVDRIEDITGPAPSGGGAAPVVGRKATVKAELKKQNGDANSGKAIDTVLSESGLAMTSSGNTDGDGLTTLTIERRNPVNDGTPGQPVAFMLRAQFGLVSDSLGLTL